MFPEDTVCKNYVVLSLRQDVVFSLHHWRSSIELLEPRKGWYPEPHYQALILQTSINLGKVPDPVWRHDGAFQLVYRDIRGSIWILKSDSPVCLPGNVCSVQHDSDIGVIVTGEAVKWICCKNRNLLMVCWMQYQSIGGNVTVDDLGRASHLVWTSTPS